MPRPLTHRRTTPLSEFHFGVCYYPEHCAETVWESDATRMAAASVNLARMAEFAWDRMEPEEGRFDFSFFDRVIDVLARHGISTMLCTPTAAPPRWLTKNYPELLRHDANGRPLSHGSRQHVSHLHPGFDEHSRRITAAMAEHFRDHPHVVGWQTDNEFNCHFSEDHSPGAQSAFIEWCRQRYVNDIDRLNDAWGACFWANTYRSFEDLVTPRPMAPTHLNPAHVLDYHRFLSDGAASFQRTQVEILRRANPGWWITHNGTFEHIDFRGPFTEDLDFLSFDNYPMFKADPQDRPAWDARRLDRTRGWSGNFFVAEQQSGAGGQPPYMHDSPAPGEMRQMAWRSVARGADGLMFFRWRSCRFGAEQYWQGLIDHDDVGRRRYDEATQLGHEFRQLGPRLLGTSVRTDVAIAGPDSAVDAAFEACHFGLPRPDEVAADVHRHLYDRGIATGFVHPEDDLSDVKLYVVPHWAVFDPAWADPLRRWVEAGGVLLIGAISATRDTHNNIVAHTPPGVLAELAGVHVDDYTRVNEPRHRPMQIDLADHDPLIPGEHWIESLVPQADTQVLGTWCGQWFDGQPAITQNTIGQGRVVYVGAWLTPTLIDALMPRLLKQAGVDSLLPHLPAQVEAVQRVGDDVELTFLLNHGTRAVSFALPHDQFRDPLSDEPAPSTCTLPPMGVTILESPQTPQTARSNSVSRPALEKTRSV
ncbi:MAG: beta-galactosidase [Planctomycetota bacterium]